MGPDSHLAACGESGVVTTLPFGEQILLDYLSFSQTLLPLSRGSLLDTPEAERKTVSSMPRGSLSVEPQRWNPV